MDTYHGKCIVKNPDIVSRTIADELVLVPVRRKASDVDSIFVINEVGRRIWELVGEDRQISHIVNCILEEYDVEQPVAEKAVVNFIQQLEQISAVRVL